MKRYEVRRISENWFGIWDAVCGKYMLESTGYGIKVYADLFNC